MSDSRLSYAHREGRLLDIRLVDNRWRKDKFPAVDIEVPTYELPLPEGVGEEKLQQEQLSMREIDQTWRERLHERASSQGPQPSNQ